jgi:hypothetical protein
MELLEECKAAILANLQKWQYKDEVALYNVLQKIEAELAKPEPDPVAYLFAWIDDDGDEVNKLGFSVPKEGLITDLKLSRDLLT